MMSRRKRNLSSIANVFDDDERLGRRQSSIRDFFGGIPKSFKNGGKRSMLNPSNNDPTSCTVKRRSESSKLIAHSESPSPMPSSHMEPLNLSNDEPAVTEGAIENHEKDTLASSSSPFGRIRPVMAEKMQRLSPKQKHSRHKHAFEQLYLDLGQRDFAKQTVCAVCNMLYVHGLEEDTKQHAKICNHYKFGVPFRFATNETKAGPRVVCKFAGKEPEEFIVEVRCSDSYALRQKADQVRSIVDKELGFPESIRKPDHELLRRTYLYIVDKRVVGMILAEPIKTAFVLVSNLDRSRHQSRKVLVGIRQMWVHPRFRGRGLACHLVDAVRNHFLFGCVIAPQQIAFSSPTEAGASFARKYIEQNAKYDCNSENHHSPEILMYDCQH